MDLDLTQLDPGFLTVDADARFGDVVDLVSELSPPSVVVREAPGFRGREDADEDDEDDDDIFYIFDGAALLAIEAPRDTLIGALVATAGTERAPVLDPSPRRRSRGGVGGVASARPPTRRGGGSGVVRGGGAAGVVLSGGVPGGLAARTAGAAASAGEDPAGVLGVAVDYPRSAAVNSTISLIIGLTSDVSGPDVIPFDAATGDVIDVFVSPRAGFVVEGPPEGQLSVVAGAPLPIQVKLRATTIGGGSVAVYAFRGGAALGVLTVAIDVLADGVADAEEGARASAGATLSDAGPAEADLQLVILEQRDEHNQPELRFLLSSRDPELGLNLKSFGPTVLETGPGGYFTDLYKEIEKLPVDSEQDRAEATERLHAIGSTLFTDLLPADLRNLLWELRERIKTVWIQSEEPYVPWELCRLQGTAADGSVVEGDFFCEAFALTRWIPGVGVAPVLRLSNVGVIVPGDSGLDSAQAEKVMLHGLAREGRAVTDIAPNYLDVRKALASAQYDAIHFSGHGKFPDQSNPARAEIELEGGKKLRPSDISGVAANFGRRRPLVFLNACQVGQQAPGLTGVGGWASALLHNGAAAFVGTHWEVTDDLALTFATTFYASLDAGETIASAARDARLAIRAAGDPTWLAYTIFAEPGATLAG